MALETLIKSSEKFATLEIWINPAVHYISEQFLSCLVVKFRKADKNKVALILFYDSLSLDDVLFFLLFAQEGQEYSPLAVFVIRFSFQ